MEKYIESGSSQISLWSIRIACWIPKSKNTHSKYVIHITFPLQQWLHERVSVLHYTYLACLVVFVIFCQTCWIHCDY